MSFIQLFFVRGDDLANQPHSPSVSDAEESQSVEEVDQTSLSHTETDHLEGDRTTSTELEDGSQTTTEADAGDDSERHSTDKDISDQPLLASLFGALLACFKKVTQPTLSSCKANSHCPFPLCSGKVCAHPTLPLCQLWCVSSSPSQRSSWPPTLSTTLYQRLSSSCMTPPPS